MTSLLQRGCIKSVQFINQWVKPTLSAPDDKRYRTSTIQVNINQVNAAKSIVLFNGINSFTDNSDPSVLSYIKYDDTCYTIDSIENNCVKFILVGLMTSNDILFHVVFQLIEFY